MNTYRITFPSVHGPGRGAAYYAEADAPSEAHAVRAVLEAIAAQGVTLDHVVLANIQDLKGAKLDGLKLSNCRLESVDLAGASLRGAEIADTVFDHVHADRTTILDGATLEGVRFVDCSLNGMVARGIQANVVCFERGTAIGLDVSGSDIGSLKVVRGFGIAVTPVVSWKIAMTWFRNTREDAFVIGAADASENEKAAARALVHSAGNRADAQRYFDGLEAQAAA